MFKHTPDQAREAWIQALRSGQYAQGRFHLRKDDRFSCHGVACDLFLKMEGQGKWDQDGCFATTPDDTARHCFPDSVREWLGLLFDPICRGDIGITIAWYLRDLNDREDNCFNVIATLIEIWIPDFIATWRPPMGEAGNCRTTA